MLAALLPVLLLLCLTIWRQCRALGSRGQVLDALGIVPQWKFFAQSAIATGTNMIDDFHLLVRTTNGTNVVQPWRQIFWNDERRWIEAFWNPDMRLRSEIQERMLLVCSQGSASDQQRCLTSLPYLTLLRYCLDSTYLAEGQLIQFAIATTEGRGERPLSVRFLSAWHTH